MIFSSRFESLHIHCLLLNDENIKQRFNVKRTEEKDEEAPSELFVAYYINIII